jgi:hypothetical protein
MDGTHKAKDLTREKPRSMTATYGGYVWLPRMIDKACAARAGTLGAYYRYPCPIDKTCLQLLGVNADTFADIAEAASSDKGVLLALRQHGVADPNSASFDPIKLNKRLHDKGS